MKFVKRQIEIKIFGGKKIARKFVEIKKNEANSEWAIINDAIIDGKPYGRTKTSITDIVSIVDTNRTLTPDSDSDKRTSVERRSSSTSGYESRPLSRASRSTTATPMVRFGYGSFQKPDRSVAFLLNLRKQHRLFGQLICSHFQSRQLNGVSHERTGRPERSSNPPTQRGTRKNGSFWCKGKNPDTPTKDTGCKTQNTRKHDFNRIGIDAPIESDPGFKIHGDNGDQC